MRSIRHQRVCLLCPCTPPPPIFSLSLCLSRCLHAYSRSDGWCTNNVPHRTFVYRHRGGKRGVPLKNDEVLLYRCTNLLFYFFQRGGQGGGGRQRIFVYAPFDEIIRSDRKILGYDPRALPLTILKKCICKMVNKTSADGAAYLFRGNVALFTFFFVIIPTEIL